MRSYGTLLYLNLFIPNFSSDAFLDLHLGAVGAYSTNTNDTFCYFDILSVQKSWIPSQRISLFGIVE